MKTKFIFITALLLSTGVALAQDLKLIEVETNQVLELKAEDAWTIISDFNNLPKLTPEVVKSVSVNNEGIAATWEIFLNNGNSIMEKMTYFNPTERTMSYIMTKTPMPIKGYRAIMKVEPYGISKSLVSFYTTCETSSENFVEISNTFENFQKLYLSNIKNLKL